MGHVIFKWANVSQIGFEIVKFEPSLKIEDSHIPQIFSICFELSTQFFLVVDILK